MISTILAIWPLVVEKAAETSPFWLLPLAGATATMIGKDPEQAKAAVASAMNGATNFVKGVGKGAQNLVSRVARATDAKSNTVTQTPSNTERTDAISVTKPSPAAERLYAATSGASRGSSSSTGSSAGAASASPDPEDEKEGKLKRIMKIIREKKGKTSTSEAPATEKAPKTIGDRLGYTNGSFYGNTLRAVRDYQVGMTAVNGAWKGIGAGYAKATGRKDNTSWGLVKNATPIGWLGQLATSPADSTSTATVNSVTNNRIEDGTVAPLDSLDTNEIVELGGEGATQVNNSTKSE